MKITFHKIRFKNLLSSGNEFEAFNLKEDQFTVVVGANGSGKSQLLDAISYVLFKKPYRKITLNQLINTKNKRGLLVEIAFSVGGHDYIVRRGEKPKVFEIYRDKKLIEADPSINDMQEYLETQILRQNFKTFCQINLIGKVTYVPFMSLQAADRRKIVENILDSNIYTVMQALAKEELKVNVADCTDIENHINILKNRLEVTKSLIAQQDVKRDEEIKSYRDLILESNTIIQQITESIKSLRESVADLVNLINTKQAEQLKIIPDYDKYQMIRDKVGGEYNSTTLERGKKLKMIADMDKLTTCPHCQQDVDQSHKDSITSNLKAEIEVLDIKINDLLEKKEKIKRIDSEYSAVEQNIRGLTQQVFDLNSQIKIHEKDIESRDRNISLFNQKIKNLEEPVKLPDNIENTEAIQSQIDYNVRKRDDLLVTIDNYKQVIKLLGDDGIKAYLIDKYIPIINSTINEYLEKMDLFVDFELDNQFNETIKSNYLDTFSYESFSEGQKMRIDLAILLAWRQIGRMRNSMSTNLLFLDEIADASLDQNGVIDFLNILKTGIDADNIFLISHNNDTIDQFENVIKVEMDRNGFTKYTKT